MNGNDVELNGVGLETDRTISEPAQAIAEARAQEAIPCETASAPVSAHAAEAVKSDAPAPKAAPAQREAPKKAQPQKPAAKSHNSSKNAKGKEKKQDSLLADLASLLLRIGWIAFVIAVLLLVVCGVTVNSGNRMYPAFHDRDIVFYYRLAKDIKAGETVVFEAEHGQLLVGRVIAKEGDTVEIDERGLKINGYYQSEKYAQGDTVLFEGGIAFPVELKAGQYFVLCDDRSESSDSRTLGPINTDRIRGRVMLSLRQRDF